MDCFSGLLPECLQGPLLPVLTAQISHAPHITRETQTISLRLRDPVSSQLGPEVDGVSLQPNDERFYCSPVLKQDVRIFSGSVSQYRVLDTGLEGCEEDRGAANEPCVSSVSST